MSRSLKLMAVGAIVAAGCATAALAQGPQDYRGRGPAPGPVATSPQLTVFLRPNFTGQSGAYTGPVERAPPTMIFGSMQLRGAWQFCTGANFSGACVTTDRDQPSALSLGLRGAIGSFRPVNNGPMPPAPQPQQERGDNPNLRGVSSTFFARPAERGLRVAVDDDRGDRGDRGDRYDRDGRGRPNFERRVSEQDVQREADRFCRANGYGSARYSDSEQVNRRVYLADVLCVRNR